MKFATIRHLLAALCFVLSMSTAQAYEGFCGNYVQIGSNAGDCPTCKLTIADNPEILKYFAEASNGWSAELSWKAGNPANASGTGKWRKGAGGNYALKLFNISMNAQYGGRTLHMRMMVSDGGVVSKISATYACTDKNIINPRPVEAPAPTPVGVWKADGKTIDEENEGGGMMYSASVKLPASPDVSFSLRCFPKVKKIELAMDGREVFETLAKAALKAGKGRFGSKDSYIDLLIEGQPYPLKASFYEMNGELVLGQGYRADGPIVKGLLKANNAMVSNPAIAFPVPLQNSGASICQTLKQCGIIQPYCVSKGR